MFLEIDNQKNCIFMSYKNDSNYFKIFDKMEEEFYEWIGFENWFTMKQTREKEFKSLHKSAVIKQAHIKYWNSLEYSLRELLGNFKAITKVYGDYLILDYNFEGIFLRDDGFEMCHCQFGADDEEFEDWAFNCHLLGKTLNDFVKELTAQKRLGDIMVESIKIELLPNKANKSKRKRTHIPRGMRHEVFKRDNYTCVECGARKKDGATLHIDHKVPVSKGGTDELDNLQTLCSDCNLNKSDVIQ